MQTMLFTPEWIPFEHFSGQKPAFTGLITAGDDVGRHLCQILNVGRRIKVFTFSKCFCRCTAQLFQKCDSEVCDRCGTLFRTEVLGLEVLVVKAVEQEIHQVRHDCLSTFGFEQVDQIIVCCRQKFYEDLADDADLRLLLIGDRKRIKVMYDLTAELLNSR